MPVRRSRLAAVIVTTAVSAGVVIVVLAARAVAADRTDDAAWVAVALGLLCAAWGVAFARLPDDAEDTRDNGLATTVEPRIDAGAAGGRTALRLSDVLVTGIATTAVYVVARVVGRPVDSALVGAMGFLVLRTFSRVVDRVVRRRGRADGGSVGGDTADA